MSEVKNGDGQNANDRLQRLEWKFFAGGDCWCCKSLATHLKY